MAEPIGVGIVGTQFMGKAHSNAFINVDKFFDVDIKPVMHTACGLNPELTDKFAKRFGWANSTTKWEELVADPAIGLVDVCTPGDTHAVISIAAAEAGKHVFCEKPLANSLEEAEQMLAAVRKAGVRHMVNFCYRRAPTVALAKQIVASGGIGEVRQFRATYLQDWLVDPQFPMTWRMDKTKAGSGVHGDLNAHIIDLARYITGDEIVRVVGDCETFIKERPYADGSGMGQVTVDDAAQFIARFKSGALGTFEASRMAPGRKNDSSFEISGSKGSIAWNFEAMNELRYFSTEDPEGMQGFRTILATESSHPYVEAWWPPGHLLGYEHGFVNGVYDLLQAISQGTDVAPDFRDGAQCVAVLDAVMTSVASKSWEEVKQIN